jgi:hypothetical protein
MLAHTAAGEPAAALAAYEHLRQTLADELGTDPAPDTQSLHLTILRGGHGPEGGEGEGTAAAAGRPSDAWFVGREGEQAEFGAAWNGAVGGGRGW